MTKDEKAKKVLDILDNPPDRRYIRDPDTILADIIQNADAEVTGIADELVKSWQKATDKQDFEMLFELLTDKSFEEYLDLCLEQSTRDPEQQDPEQGA